MTARTIPREEWVSFCEGFSGQHEGWLVTIEVDTHTIAEDEPLAAVEAEPATRRITVRFGRSGREHEVEVPGPTAIRFRQTPRGEHQGLRIESADGRSVEVRFRSPARPETLDGYVGRR